MNRNHGFLAFWVRGLWVFLMIIAINLTLGAVCAGAAFLLRPLFPQPLLAAYGIVLLTMGLPFAGWVFEQLALRLPRIPS